MNELLANLNIDTILSDPMLLVGTALVVLGPLVFLIALIKFISLRGKTASEEEFFNPLANMHHPEPTSEPEPEPEPEPSEPPPHSVETRPARSQFAAAQERTMVMPAGTAELQAQIEIAISQIKNLNKKVNALEEALQQIARNQGESPLEAPASPSTPAAPSSPGSPGSRPPIMPL